MIKVNDFMMKDPCCLLVTDKIAKAKTILNYSCLEAIPVIGNDRSYAGIIRRMDIIQENIVDTDEVVSYMHESQMILNNEDLLSIITRLKIEDNYLIPVLDNLGCLTGILPQPNFLANVYFDIEKALRTGLKNEEEISEHGIIVVDEDGKIVCFNINAEKIIGFRAKEIYGTHVNKIIHDSRLCEVAKKGKPHIKQKVKLENRVTLCSNRFPLYIDNQIVGAIGFFEDISEKEKLRATLRKLRNVNKNLVNVLETINDGIIVVDNNGTIVRVNAAFEEITGICANDCLGVDVRELAGVPTDYADKVLDKQIAAHFITTIREKEYLILTKPILDGDGQIAYFVTTLKDIDKVNELISDLQVTQEMASRYYSDFKNMYGSIGKEDMIANSGAMKRVVNLALRVAQVDSSILITGETGVGKEVLARAIHKCSQRMDKSFVKLNCGAIPKELLESELFGYESGAFTGALRQGKPGLIEMADGGTLFLDEIGDLPLDTQVKFLRVLQEREIQKVGGVKTKKVDFRLIAATNRSLEEMVKQGDFREDLFYRLNVVPVRVPPLRERKEDIVPLVIFFLNKFNKKYGMTKKLSPEVVQSFLKYDWHGNVRELENTIERLIVTSDSNLILIEHLIANTNITQDSDKSNMYLKDVLEQTEKELILQAFKECRTTREMADVLGISQSAVVKKMRKYGIKNLTPSQVSDQKVLTK